MKRAGHGIAHSEVELRQPDPGDGRTGTSWRPIRRVDPDGTMRPLRFSTLEAAHAYAGRMSRQESRIVWVRGDGWRRTMDAGET
jgi:hypothetical protein